MSTSTDAALPCVFPPPGGADSNTAGVTPPPAGPGTPAFADLSTAGLRAAAEAQTAWLWHGYLAPGNVTLLTSQWKSGKTTLVAVLLARLKAGGELAGLPLAAGKAAVVSEESPQHWYRRAQRLHFGDHVCWFCRPFRARPRPDEWLALVDHLVALRHRHGLDLVVIDPLASFLPTRGENDAAAMLDTLLPLQRLTRLGVSVLILHHPRKGRLTAGQAARGSGALTGYADVLIEMHWYGRLSDGDRRRKLQAYSRYEETPRQLVVELTADGTDYLARGDFEAHEFSHGWDVLRLVLEDAPGPLTRREVLEAWPPDHPAPGDTTLWRWLERAAAQGLVHRDGEGKKNQPFRYRLAGQGEK